MSVGNICVRHVFTIGADADVVEAARRMRELHVGFLIVVDPAVGDDLPVGVLTDRDLVLEVLAQDVDPHAVAVKDIMTPDPLIAREDDELHDTLLRMRAAGVRRVPVSDDSGKLVGVLSVDDVVGFLNEAVQDLAGAISRELNVERRLRA
ncbi:MAG TPA: CBS domain-containing protein [Steroidobacteraceae bacterium]|nr:CBS domain-containing protein [Steroidobacteraceae bacterium]